MRRGVIVLGMRLEPADHNGSALRWQSSKRKTSRMKPKPSEIRRKARRINRRKDLPRARNLAFYSWRDAMGDTHSASLQKRDRQVLDALRVSPVWCASPVRIGDSVLRLRRDHSIPVETVYFHERDGDESITFGAYALTETIEREGE